MGSGPQPQYNFDKNNHAAGVTNDADGNVLNDGINKYTYDAENRLLTLYGGPGENNGYIYDAEGRRVVKNDPDYGQYLYDISGHRVAELTSTGLWNRGEVYDSNGRHVATYTGGASGTTYFDFADSLGTERVRTTVAGTVCETITNLPFGDAQGTTGSCGDVSPAHFTGKERDDDSGLDNFGARQYSSGMGRFMQPDWSNILSPVPYASVDDPQTLNLYSYVRNNPTTVIDPDGHCWGIISWWQHACNAADGLGWRSDAQVEQAVHDAREWLRENTSFSAAQQEGLNAKQALALYKGFQNHDQTVVSDGKKWTLQFVSVLPGVIPPRLYRGGTDLTPRPGDVKIDPDTGLLKTTHGVSLDADPANLGKYGGTNEIDQSTMPEELKIEQRGMRPDHYEIMPRQPMTMERFNELVSQIKFK